MSRQDEPQAPGAPMTLEQLAAMQNDLLRQAIPVMAAMDRTTSPEGMAQLAGLEMVMLAIRDAMRAAISMRTLERAGYPNGQPARRPRHLAVVRSDTR